MGVLVDNRGILRVYGNSNHISLVNYMEGFPLHHQLSYQKRAEIPLSLLDGVKPRYERLVKPRFLWVSNTIDISHLKTPEAMIVLPVPISTYSLTNRNTDRVVKDYYQCYAYNHKVLIITTNYIVLPNGILVSTKHPLIADYLKTNREIKLPRRTYSTLEKANNQAEELVGLLISTLGLPEAKLQYYPFQTIGYLQIVRNRPPQPIVHNNKILIGELEAREIRYMLNVSRGILREFLTKSKHALGQYIAKLTIRNFSETLPISAFMYTQRLSYRLPPPTSQLLYQYKTKISLS
jgi:hypothetical protein